MNNKEQFMNKVISNVVATTSSRNADKIRSAIFYQWGQEESKRNCFLYLGIEDYEQMQAAVFAGLNQKASIKF